MAKEYYANLLQLLEEVTIEEEVSAPLEVKHFFSGAALYVNGTICASWSPVGLAFKLPEKEVDALIASGEAIPLRYFPKGHIKTGYALFEDPASRNSREWRAYLIRAARQTEGS